MGKIMKKIESVNNEYIKKLAKLKEKKYRDLEGKFLVEGYHLVNEAKDYLQEVLIIKEEDKIEGINNILVTENIIEKLSSVKTPQKIIGVCKCIENNVLKGDRYLILDNIQDPGNLGTLIRSALGFNIDTIVASRDTVSIYNDKVIRSTQGAIFHINYVLGDLEEIIKKLKEKHITVISTSLKSSVPLKEIKEKNIEKYAIILGNEGNGVQEEIQKLADINVKIEMNEKLESLNVSSAGAIIMYSLMK